MILDNLYMFCGTSNGEVGGITASPYTDSPTAGTQQASNDIDLGLVGLPTFANGGGARDMGTGDDPALKLLAVVTVAGNGAGASLQCQLQGAPDNGAGGEGAFVTMWTGPVVLEANLVVGCQLANIDVPRPVPTQPWPRFLRLNFITAGGPRATLQVEASIVIDRFDQHRGITQALSGYPAGITVAN